MSEDVTRPFRYHDEARRLGEELVSIEVVAPKLAAHDGMGRIARGETALAGIPANQAAAVAAVPSELQKRELQQKLQTLLDRKQRKVASFVGEAKKLANPSAPDVALSAMTSGTGMSGVERPSGMDMRLESVHQGPAANLFAAGLKALREGHGKKIAASRLDKEVAKGNVRYQDAVPMQWYDPRDPKSVSRQQQMSGTNLAPSALHRKRNLDDAIVRNTYARAGVAKREVAVRGLAGNTPAQLGAPHSPQRMINQQALLDSTVHSKFLPGAGPAMTQGEVYVPRESGQFLRGITNPMTAQQAINATEPFSFNGSLPAHQPVDKTLTRAVLDHEQGERNVLLGHRKQKVDGKDVAALHPHATHLGVEPTMREAIITKGDVEAQGVFKKLRGHGDDAQLQAILRNAGHHPDAPIPIGGRVHRAIEKRLEKGKAHLSSDFIGNLERGVAQIAPENRPHIATASTAAERLSAYNQRASGALRGLMPRARNFMASRPGKLLGGAGAAGVAGIGAFYGGRRLLNRQDARA